MKWPLLCGLLALASARMALAADGAYTNNVVINYPVNVSSPPVIDATNFINNNLFIINFTALATIQPFYETSDTLNYTNRGLMMANTGFQFDNQSSSTGLRTMSGSFYNPATISCGSATNLGDPFGGSLYLNGIFPQCLVNATNILNPGWVDVGIDGLIQFTGANVDLTRSRLKLEGVGANAFGTGYYGLNTSPLTNGNTIFILIPPWDPSIYLGANFAISGLFPIAPNILALNNSTAYFDFASPNPSNNIIRSVFIEDTSAPNVAYKVYFDTASLGFGGGNATVEWAGSYQDVASGTFHTNYLYLNNNYLQSVATNDGVLGAIPLNFTFTESASKLIFQAPAAAGFFSVFPSGTVTNRYAFANAQLLPGSWATNQISNLSVTNLPGRVQMSATHELNLALAQISGPNYMSVQSTNQFDGSPGASIQVPYSDLNLGVTNGFLSISNLLTPNLPSWSGNVQAWSTRFTTTSTNSLVVFSNGLPVSTNAITITNDFRVLLVGSQVTPTSIAQVQDMLLHGTNSIVISDALNVMRTFNADAQSLTLTTNGAGRGATSLDGEFNVASPDSIYWASSLPNLRNLTNNGAIRLQNLSQFVGTSNNVVVTPPVAASAILTNSANVVPLNKVIIGANAYVFTNTLNNSTPNLVKIAASADGTMSNLIAAINATNGAGTSYSSSTVPNAQVTVGLLSAHAFTVTAITNGPAGNWVSANKSTATTNLFWIGASPTNTLSGGTVGTTNGSSVQVPYYNFVNHGLLSDSGSEIWADNFESSGVISNGNLGSFTLQSQTAAFTNGALFAGGDVSITTGNLLASNLVLEADRSLTLTVTNFLTDTGVTNGNVWSVGAASVGEGLSLPVLPATANGGAAYGNSLLGTTITLFAPAGENVVNTWAANDFGVSTAGYTNNMAIGHLVLDAQGASSGTQLSFNGVGVSNAIYVDRLELRDYASWTNHDSGGNLPALVINPNLVIYYADAIAAGADVYTGGPADVSRELNHKNNDHLRWVPTYAGFFSSTNMVFAGTTNGPFNIALAQSSDIDSDGDGIANAFDPTPFFLSSMISPVVISNTPSGPLAISWNSIPHATNYVVYSTDNSAGSFTNLLTNFSTNNAGPFTMSNFISPIPYPSPPARVMIFTPVPGSTQYYWPVVNPWMTYPY